MQSKFFDKKEKTGENKTALKKNKHKRGSFSFQGGMQVLNCCTNISRLRQSCAMLDLLWLLSLWCYPAQTLTDTLCKELGKENLKLNSKVLTLGYGHDESSSSPNWSITCVSNQSTQDIDAVIMTVSVAIFLYPFPFFH